MTIPTRSIEFKVGAFVGAGILLAILAILMMGGSNSIFQRRIGYNLALDAVDGLAPGSVVLLSGIPIGNVSNIEFMPDKNQIRVYLKVDRAFETKITEGSLGSLRTQGALGDRYVFIEPGPMNGQPLAEDGWLVTQVKGDIFSTITQSGDEIKRVFTILKELETFTGNLNANGRSAILMQNLSDGSKSFKGAMEDLHSILNEIKASENKEGLVKKSLSHLSSIMEKLDHGQGTLGALINDSTLHEKIKDLVGGSDRSRYMKGVIRNTIKTNDEQK